MSQASPWPTILRQPDLPEKLAASVELCDVSQLNFLFLSIVNMAVGKHKRVVKGGKKGGKKKVYVQNSNHAEPLRCLFVRLLPYFSVFTHDGLDLNGLSWSFCITVILVSGFDESPIRFPVLLVIYNCIHVLVENLEGRMFRSLGAFDWLHLLSGVFLWKIPLFSSIIPCPWPPSSLMSYLH